MNEHKFLPDDSKLTAYAFGELDAADRAAVEVALRDDPAARAAVAAIRAWGAQLEGALATETMAEFTPEHKKAAVAAAPFAHAAIIPGRDPSKLDGGPLNGHAKSLEKIATADLVRPLAKLIKFPQFYYVAAGFAAACFAVMVALRTPRPVPVQKVYTQIDLSSLPPPMQSLPAEASVATVETKDQLVDVVAPSASAGAGASAASVPPAVSSAPASNLGGNLSLLAQAKDLGTSGKIYGPAAPSAVSIDLGNLKKQTLTNAAARNEPLVIQGAGSVTLPTVGTGDIVSTGIDGSITSNSKTATQPEARVQRASATQTYPADAKMLVTAAPQPTRAVAGAASQRPQFDQAAKPKAFGFGGGSTSFSESGTLNLRAADGIAPSGNSFGGIAMNSRDRGFIASENRGLNGYVSTNLDSVAPTGGRQVPTGADRYADLRDNEFLAAKDNPLSTFGADVDTASYANIRRFLAGHQLPPRDAVRIEELVNYFPYHYAPPAPEKRDVAGTSPANSTPFAASLEVADAPWAPAHRLVRIGLKGREVSAATRPVANLVFLLDVSGSMAAANRLPLVKESLRLLVGKLRADDRVAIVTYAGRSGLALASTPVAHTKEILDALDSLDAGGSTNGGMGIQLAYDVAKANFAPGGINRVILCTDGDFNVGLTGEGELTRLIEEKAKSGVALTALGFGMGNFKDATIEKLADHGHGNYGYIDTRREAEKLLVEQVNGTLMTIAKDVKIQVDFNSARVATYRLLGYEDRLLKKEDFKNDAVDGGEIGAGHTVTALYEIVPVGVNDKAATPAPVEASKYQRPAPAAPATGEASNELLTVRLRYKEPAGDTSQQVEFPLTDAGEKFADASSDFKFAAAVAGFGMILRDSPNKGTATMADVVTWAEAGSTDDAGGYRAEFVDLARDAENLER